MAEEKDRPVRGQSPQRPFDRAQRRRADPAREQHVVLADQRARAAALQRMHRHVSMRHPAPDEPVPRVLVGAIERHAPAQAGPRGTHRGLGDAIPARLERDAVGGINERPVETVLWGRRTVAVRAGRVRRTRVVNRLIRPLAGIRPRVHARPRYEGAGGRTDSRVGTRENGFRQEPSHSIRARRPGLSSAAALARAWMSPLEPRPGEPPAKRGT